MYSVGEIIVIHIELSRENMSESKRRKGKLYDVNRIYKLAIGLFLTLILSSCIEENNDFNPLIVEISASFLNEIFQWII